MKRALFLIIGLTLFTFGSGWWLDHLQQNTAAKYLDGLYTIRELILADDPSSALREQAYLHALWEHDSHWLNALWDHHHTRDVEAGMRRLATALQEKSRLDALFATDDLTDSLEEIAQQNMAFWENML